MNDLNLARSTRRQFLVSCVGLSAGGLALLAPPLADAAQGMEGHPLWPGPQDIRQIWLKRQQTGETAVIRYFDGQRFLQSEYERACHILRDVQANETANIDVELLDLMFAMQRWLVSWGIDRPLIINSGFRSRSTNSRIEGAAKASMHLEGRAADIAMPDVSPAYLGRLAGIFARGGVGFYVNRGFVHIDTGRIRYWADQPRRNKNK